MIDPDELEFRCPECSARAFGTLDLPPGHLHGIDTEEPTFFQYVPVEEAPKPRAAKAR